MVWFKNSLPILLLVLVSGCSSTQMRLPGWFPWRARSADSVAAAAMTGQAAENSIADGTPARLPAAMELPQPASAPTTLPSAATEPTEADAEHAVIFASTSK